MKLIKQFCVDYTQKGYDIDSIHKQIEKAGRLCYRSEDKITEDSAKEFVKRMIRLKHYGILEHGTVYLFMENATDSIKYINNKFSEVNFFKSINGQLLSNAYITTNYSVIIENGWIDDLKYICEETPNHIKRYSFLFGCDRITGESFIRHRSILALQLELHSLPETSFSFARESSRYCNFSKDKFDNNVTFNIPNYVKTDYNTELSYNYDSLCGDNLKDIEWMLSCLDAEKHYLKLIELGSIAEEARYSLGFSLHSPLIMTGFEKDWKHFLKLRCDKSAHPDARFMANKVKDILINNYKIDLNEN